MSNKVCSPTLKCGKIFSVNLPSELTINDPPIDLAQVKVNIENLKKPCVQLNYSQNIQFEVYGLNPSFSIVYRLVRTNGKTDGTIFLEEWSLTFSEVYATTIPNINTIEPLVVNYCDCICVKGVESFTYTLQLAKVTTTNCNYNITNEVISAIAICGTDSS
ncbi:DUF4489 domain-containing protein [Chengkuizengella axinellae]|uniref:DUF4489 domain-containing protein n=1 Tax=Chengkuizengella axinellae TaxID=3064388 RepID=A0ABT9J542_9BACL|nr:DUF4489 domain-containing protein [Chengkuizengella sp. 2205SS18-9]MDP5276736.1 DUF4489 domain-containing protein [Chengkuizengella sp. 2205SS18-9]